MRVDAHMHFWRYDPAEYGWIDDSLAALRRDFLPAEAQREIRAAGFDAVVAVQARQTLEETRWLLELADQHPFIAGVVGWVDLRSPEARAQLEGFARHPKLVGIRHIVQAEPDERFLLGAEFGRGIALLEQLGLAYDILIFARQLPAAVEFARRFPRQRFVLDHIAKPEIKAGEIRRWEAGIRELAAQPHVSCKISGMVTEADFASWTPEQLRPYLDVVFDCFGAARLMVGSDWPVCLAAGSYARVMGVFQEYLAGRPESERQAVLGGNAARFWNLT